MSGLIVQGLSVELDDKAILSALDLAVAPGELVGLIGPNGAGKTTALRAILGLVPASAASIDVDGKDVRALSAKARARLIAYLPQMRDVFWPVSAKTLVGLGRFAHGDADAPGGEAAIARCLADVDAAAFAERDVRTLSGGELARVLFARALAVEAPVLLADEPVAALDPGHQLKAMERLRAAARTSSVLVVLHDLALAARFCDRLYLLSEGRSIIAGTAHEVIASPELERVFAIKLLRAEIQGLPLIAPVQV
jgi:iron complex transport system ATP-binding protein